MATRPKAKNDLKIAQGKQRDAFFERLKRQSQPRKAAATPRPAEAPSGE